MSAHQHPEGDPVTDHKPGDPHTMSPERLADIRSSLKGWSRDARALDLLAEVDHHLAAEQGSRGQAEALRHDATERLVYALVSKDEAALAKARADLADAVAMRGDA